MQIEPNADLSTLNTLALSGRARAFARAADAGDIDTALDFARAQGLAVLPWGGGSNIVVAGDVDALVLQVATRGRQLLSSTGDTVLLRIEAGENWHDLVRWTVEQGYSGLANLALIPGTVGAAPIQNIGAYGVELEPFVDAVHGRRIDSGEPIRLSARDCAFGYRDSIFKGELRDTVVITAVDLRLSASAAVECSYPGLAARLTEQGIARPAPRDVFDAVVAIRRARLPDPAKEPNAGSFFKNPLVSAGQAEVLQRTEPEMPSFAAGQGLVKIPAAWLIERCGWKGLVRDGVGVHPAHSLVLVNCGANIGERLLQLAADIRASVQARFAIDLEIEPRIYGAAT
ncbi:UDP-N-acetylmuramate dehydrogenase [Parahaliea aestuarii]|uniref:UDP-N-acetylenolpyruvoylglucosamine reductase n=1 Tax=Parahaliea aestuarii TaxID=1852021 RepID=A0A5C8ZZJ0_9GAMM|nr:UDP-N-acetylmuramate dehydrogenase [Parahaliea aestuarii]TXS93154.1 UDP-N-acetylmuramate dehydrogenase [Parahaliea aestuarii]